MFVVLEALPEQVAQGRVFVILPVIGPRTGVVEVESLSEHVWHEAEEAPLLMELNGMLVVDTPPEHVLHGTVTMLYDGRVNDTLLEAAWKMLVVDTPPEHVLHGTVAML